MSLFWYTLKSKWYNLAKYTKIYQNITKYNILDQKDFHIHTVSRCEYIAFAFSENQFFGFLTHNKGSDQKVLNIPNVVPGIIYHLQKTELKLDHPRSRYAQKT